MRRASGWRFVAVVLAVVAAACGSDPEALKRQYVASGDAYFAAKKYAEAIVQYRNAVETANDFGEAHEKLAIAYAAAGDRRGALREYVRAADLLRSNTGVQLEAAKHLLAAGQFEDAASRVQRVLDEDPKHVEALVLRGSALAGLRDVEGAVRQVEQAVTLDPDRALTHTNLAVLKLAQGNTEAARASFERAVLLDPKSVPALLGLATFQWGVNELTAAEQTLQRILAVDPRYVPAHQLLGALYLTSARAQQAEPHVKAIADITQTTAAQFALSDYYRSTNRSADARRVLEAMPPADATAADIQQRLAQLAYDSGEVTRAHAMVDEVLKKNPRNATGLLLKARWLLREGKHADARGRAAAAVKAQPELASAHYVLGIIHATERDKDAAAQSFREVLRLNPSATVAQLQLARLELARGETDEAVALAEGVLKNAPRNPDARLSTARALIARQDLKRAEPLVRELLNQYPGAAAAHALEGTLLLARNDVAAARQSFGRAFELDRRSAEARARIDARLAEEPARVDLLTLSAQLAVTAGEPARAEQTLRRIIELAPADNDAYALLARVYLSQRKLDSARAEFDQLAQRRPRDISSRTMAAMIVHAQNDLRDAKSRYETILALDPNAAVAANNLAWIYAEEQNNLDRALRLAQNAVRSLPDSAQAHDTLGWIHYKMEVPGLAIAPLERAVALEPGNAQHLYHLGFAYAKTGEAAKARTALTQALKLQPRGAEADQARAALQSLGT